MSVAQIPPPALLPVTPTRVLTFADCPRRYRMRYLDRPRPPVGPPWAHNSVGSAVHGALRDWWGLAPERRTPAAAAGLVRAGWQEHGFRDGGQSRQWQERAAGWVRRYAEEYLLPPAGMAEPVGVERTVAVRDGDLAISGRVDRLDLRGDQLVVVDYKTGRRPGGEQDARSSLQLALYALASAATLRRDCWQVELHHLPTGTVSGWRHTPAALERHRDRAAALAREADRAARTGAFPAVTGPLCSWCEMRAHCPQGRRAAPELPPWAGLDAPARPG